MANFRFSTRAATLLAAVSTLVISGAISGVAQAQPATGKPALIITNDPLPESLQKQLYSKPTRAPEIPVEKVSREGNEDLGETVVGHKVDDMRNEFFKLQGTIGNVAESLSKLEDKNRSQSAEYYANVANISTQLQSGTTPGNPRLIKRLSVARNSLESLASNVSLLNDMAVEIANVSSTADYMLESVRATYSLSGAVEEDHARLAQLEDSINNSLVAIERLQNSVNDDITRTVTYLGTERNNMRTLTLAVTTGDLFGKSLSNRPFSNVQEASFVGGDENSMPAAPVAAVASTPVAETISTPEKGLEKVSKADDAAAAETVVAAAPEAMKAPAPAPAMLGAPRPLVKIRFDKPNVAFEQPVYMAVNEALGRYPNARFELVAVHPTAGNAAQNTIESTRARRNAEKVLRTLTQMGLTMDRVDLSYMQSPDAASSEVHLYIQ